MNWDVSMGKINRKMGISVIMRDPIVEVLASCKPQKIIYIIDMVIAESIAASRSTIFIRELGLQNVKLEVDALQIVQTLQKDDKNWCRYGQLIGHVRGSSSRVLEPRLSGF